MKRQNLNWRLLGGALLLCGLGVRAEIVVVDGEPIVKRNVNIRSTAVSRSAEGKTNAPSVMPTVVRTEDSMNFLNGDKLHGMLVNLDGAGGLLTWQHKAAPDPMRYQLAALDKLDLFPRKVEGQQSQKSIVQLVNGDRLRGDVVTLDGKQMVLKTWYAGTLNIARTRLSELAPAAAPADVLYEGPTSDLAGWVTEGSSVRGSGLAYRNGGLALPLGRAVGRKIPNLPEKVRFEFELSNFANSYFVFWFFSDSPRNMGGNDAYYMNFYGSRMEFQRMMRNEGNRSLGSIDNDSERRMKSHMLVSILADRKERRFAVLLDGKLVREFTDPQDFKGVGDCIMFQTHQASSMKISKIKIARWDGKLPKTEGGGGGGAVEQDTLVFINGDAMSGAVRSITTNNVKFETSYAVLDVPLERIARMRFANKLDLAPLPVSATTNAAAASNTTVTATAVADPAGGAAAAVILNQVAINGVLMANGPVVFSSSGRRRTAKTTSEPAAPVILYAEGSTRCFFADQEAVTLKLDKITNEGVTGSAEGIGALKMPLGALTRLEFNPNAKRTGSEGDDDDL
ncbi:MAG: hypothetical protein NTY53_05490 [Kiritimatiellaeota bacterium]|nr:hypothetical protein [Kiritimatiellota bacterium]